ncbi:MAG TPA: NAD(P)-dependent oxidoreductase [archaeon]|nr:NAD(P)-dependent oxidoreductase [archaeon]
MAFKKILVTGFEESELSPEFWKRIDSVSEQKIFLPKDSPEIKQHLANADCLLVKFNPVTEDWIKAAPNLKYIGVLATGYGKVALEVAKNRCVVVTNVPGYSTESVAEFVFAVILKNIRHLGRAKRQAKEGNYSESGFSATEIKDKVFGVIGAGKIGTRVAEIAQGFGANVKYWNRSRKKDLESNGIKYEDVDRLFTESDIISLNLALTKETENFLNAKRIHSLKNGAIVVNTSPMELVDLGALEQRLTAMGGA